VSIEAVMKKPFEGNPVAAYLIAAVAGGLLMAGLLEVFDPQHSLPHWFLIVVVVMGGVPFEYAMRRIRKRSAK
jgi:hypothetical protein